MDCREELEENVRILARQKAAVVDDIKAVELYAELRQLKTMADGSVNVIINVPEDCREQVKVMFDWFHLMLHCVIAVDE